jgi:hypothetical protein
VQLPQVPFGKRQSWCAFFLVHRAVEARARRLVSTGAAQAAAPASPTVRSNSRRVTRLGSTVHLRFVWMATSRYVRVSSSASALDRRAQPLEEAEARPRSEPLPNLKVARSATLAGPS